MRIAILILFAAFTCHGQTISPVSIDAGHGKVKDGQVTITNIQPTPLAASISYSQFKVQDGKKIVLAALEPGVIVKLYQNSLKIPPQQSRTIDYRLTCPEGCNIEISVACMSPSLRVEGSGVLIRLILPSLVYVAAARDSGKNQRAKVLLAGGFHLNERLSQ